MPPPAWWSALDAAVRAMAPRVLPALDASDDTRAFWLTSPAQMGADFLVWTPLLAAVFWALLRDGPARLWRVAVSPAPPSTRGAVQALLAAADAALRVCAWATYAVTLTIKLSMGRAIFLLQPCHVSNALICALTLVDARGPWGDWAARALWVDMLAKYGTATALIVADVGPAPVWGETACFFIQHWMLVLLPAVWLLRRRFAVFTGARAIIFAWAVCSVQHLCFLLPVNLLSGRNVNYMSAPPPGVFPAALLPVEYYRSFIAVGGIFMSFAMCLFFVSPLASLGEVLTADGSGEDVAIKQVKAPRRTAVTASKVLASSPSPRQRRSLRGSA